MSSTREQTERDTAGSDSGLDDRARWRALAVCLAGGFMVLLDVSIVNVALPSIKQGLGASPGELQWVVSGYALTFGLVLVPTGRLGDVRGRREVFVLALAAFTLASAACGLAQDATMLVIFRLIQGLAGGTLTPQITGLIQELFSGKERGKAFGSFGTVIGVSTAIGPLLGGLLIAAFGTDDGWRAVFMVNVPIGLIVMPLAWRLVPSAAQKRRHDFDLVGVVLLGLAAVALLLPFVQEQEWPPVSWVLVPVALALFAGFVIWERRFAARGKEPVAQLDLFKRRSYGFGIGSVTLYFGGFTPLFFVFTLFLQNGEHYSALDAGLAITPFALGSAVSATIGGRIVTRFGRSLIAIGLLAVALGLAGAALAVHLHPTGHVGWVTALPLLVAGLGGGFVVTPNQTLTLSEVPVEHAGTAGGLLQTGQRVGAAVGIAAVGATFFAAVSRGYATAFQRGLLVAIAFVVAALLVTIAELVVDRRSQPGKHEVGKHEAGRREAA